MSQVVVRPHAAIYPDATGEAVATLAVEVVAGDEPAVVTSVGWTVESDTGSAGVFVGMPRSRHPQPRLPHEIAPCDHATWMITPEEIRRLLANSDLTAQIDESSAVLTAYAIVNDVRVVATETVGL